RFNQPPQGKVKKFIDSKNRETHFTVDTLGRNTNVHQKEGSALKLLHTINYFPSGPLSDYALPQSVVDAGGITTNFSYNAKNQLYESWQTVSSYVEKTRLIYDSDPRTSGTGKDDAYGFLVKVQATDYAGAFKTLSEVKSTSSGIYSFDQYYHPTATKGADDYEVSQTFDKLSRVTRIDFPDATFEAISYVRNGVKLIEPQSVTDRDGKVTEYRYNGNRQLFEVKDSAGGLTRYGWCSCGDLEWMQDPKQVGPASSAPTYSNAVPTSAPHTRWHRDALGRVTSKVDAAGNTTSYTYETQKGLLSSVTLPSDQGGGSATATLRYYKDGNLYQIDYADEAMRDVKIWYDSNYNRIKQRRDLKPVNDPTDTGAVDENYYYYYYSISTSNFQQGRRPALLH
ncbi:MAG: RHS repeat protein, partial [Verrucomicrobiae bacterium]|nr:RHS repeat protein [Verrucomicrobiae bacterium]